MTTILEQGPWRLAAGKVSHVERTKTDDGGAKMTEVFDGWYFRATRRQTVMDETVTPQQIHEAQGATPEEAFEKLPDELPFTVEDIQREIAHLENPEVSQ